MAVKFIEERCSICSQCIVVCTAEAIKGWEGVHGITDDLAAFLVQHGLVSPETFEGVETKDLVKLGFSEADAQQIVDLVHAHRNASGAEA